MPADVELVEVPPVARVKRSRLAIATAVTVAALPILVADNLPATAEPDRVAAVAEAPASTTSSTVATTTTTEATTTSAAPASTEAAPTTTEAPTTTAAPRPAAPAPTTTTTAAARTMAAPPPPAGEYGDPDDPATWDRLAQCESGGNWSLDSGNGYYGGLQFSLGTWQDVGGTGYPDDASREEQIRRGQILQARYGWGQWPHCTAKLGYQ